MTSEVVILGGGVGGTICANLVSRQTRGRAQVTVVDATGTHVYQPGFLYVAVGKQNSSALRHPESELLRREISLVVDRASRVDPDGRTVTLESGRTLHYDQLLLATGSRTVMDEVPGGSSAYDFYTMAGAERLWSALQEFNGGTIVVGVAGIPYKCPPAPVEFVFLVDYDLLVLVPPHRGQRVIEDSGLGDGRGWVPVDRNTLKHAKFERIWAIGDTTNIPISKSGSVAHYEASVAAAGIAAAAKGEAPPAH